MLSLMAIRTYLLDVHEAPPILERRCHRCWGHADQRETPMVVEVASVVEGAMGMGKTRSVWPRMT